MSWFDGCKLIYDGTADVVLLSFSCTVIRSIAIMYICFYALCVMSLSYRRIVENYCKDIMNCVS